jgi:FAD:protein FMN transferase
MFKQKPLDQPGLVVSNAAMKNCPSISAIGIVVLVALVTIGQWQIAVRHNGTTVAVIHHPRGIMGTDCALAAVVASHATDRARAALDEAEATLRRVESRMSSWRDDSEISRFRDAAAGSEILVSQETLSVLYAAQAAFERTGQTFDVTCRPQLELWRRAGLQNQEPTAAQLSEARAASSWAGIHLTATGIVKHQPHTSLDLGGIAKGYAIDQALQVLRQAGLPGALVDVGGDLACFGTQPGGQPWLVDVKDPDLPGSTVRLQIVDRAIATSGDYARRIEIGGKRYSHIIDPRSGRPAEAARSATVVASTAVVADIWATALSVLGPDGFDRLPEGVEALIISAGEQGHRFICTPGFRNLLTAPLPEDWECRPDGRTRVADNRIEASSAEN